MPSILFELQLADIHHQLGVQGYADGDFGHDGSGPFKE